MTTIIKEGLTRAHSCGSSVKHGWQHRPWSFFSGTCINTNTHTHVGCCSVLKKKILVLVILWPWETKLTFTWKKSLHPTMHIFNSIKMLMFWQEHCYIYCTKLISVSNLNCIVGFKNTFSLWLTTNKKLPFTSKILMHICLAMGQQAYGTNILQN